MFFLYNKIETDDDIFIIHTRALAHIKELSSSKQQKLDTQYKLLSKLMSCKPPHGYTLEEWTAIGTKYGVCKSPSPRTLISYKESKQIIQECEQLHECNQYDSQFKLYDEVSKEILDDYKVSINGVIQANFMLSTSKQEFSPTQVLLKNELIKVIEEIFGTIVMNKIVSRKTKPLKRCISSLATPCTEEVQDPDDWNGMIFNDINRINFNQKFKYDKRQHFKDTLNQYQGLQHKTIPTDITSSIIDMIEKLGLADTTKTIPKERYTKVTKEHVKMFLSETDNPLYYEDRILIHSKITDTPCPDIQHIEKALFSDFDQLVEVFLNFSDHHVDRKNFLNTHYVLRQLLKKRGIVVADDELNNLKTPARIRSHDDIYQLCCEKLGWNFTPLA